MQGEQGRRDAGDRSLDRAGRGVLDELERRAADGALPAAGAAPPADEAEAPLAPEAPATPIAASDDEQDLRESATTSASWTRAATR